MPAAVTLFLEDGRTEIIECPSGVRPEDLADRPDVLIFDYSDSRSDAEFKRANDPSRVFLL